MKKNLFFLFPILALFILTVSSCCPDDEDLNYVRVTKIVVKSFPPTQSNGDPWDNNNPGIPDLYFFIYDDPGTANGSVQLYKADYIQNSDPYGEHTFTISDVLLLPSRKTTLSFYDYHPYPETDDHIGDLSFIIPNISEKDEKENPIPLSMNGIIADVYVAYQF